MTKVVINYRHGGFGLSSAALARWCELKNRKCYFFDHHYPSDKFIGPLSAEEADNLWCRFTFDVENPNDLDEVSQDVHNIYDKDIPRDDEQLIQVIEEMGADAEDKYAALKIVEIPDDVEWEIDEYDGAEWVSEKHRTWS